MNKHKECKFFAGTDATEEEVLHVENELRNITVDGKPAINKIEKVTKQNMYDSIAKRWKDPDAMEALTVDMMKESYIINLTDLEYSKDVEAQANAIEGVVKVTNSDTTVSTLLSLGNGIKIFTLAILIVLIVVSLFIISNTIKLSVHARRKEISIMKYVGATNSFIRAPFAVEGVIIGLTSGLISILIICLAYNALADKFLASSIAQTLSTLSLVSFGEMVNLIIIIYIILGVGIGIIGSTISMRKYLDV